MESNNGRKKHMVEGDVAEIKKSEEALGTESVGGQEDRGGVLPNLLKGLFSKGK